MSQLSPFDLILQGGSQFYAALGFICNGFAAVRLEKFEAGSEHLANLVRSLDSNPAALNPAWPVADLPYVNDSLPGLLVFAISPPPYEPAQLYPFNAELLEVAMNGAPVSLRIGEYFTFRLHLSQNLAGDQVPIIAVYDFEQRLMGFVAAMHIGEDNQDAYRAALAEALEAESPAPPATEGSVTHG